MTHGMNENQEHIVLGFISQSLADELNTSVLIVTNMDRSK